MASKKQESRINTVYKLTYASGEKIHNSSVAASSFAHAIEVWKLSGNYESTVTNIERTNQLVHYGVNR